MIWIRLRKNKNAPATGRHNYLEIVNGTINKSGTLFFNDPLLLPVFPQSMLFVNERIQIGMV
jgi:hypothetical protein